MCSSVICDCGAVYERTEIERPFRDSDRQACSCCGRILESWDSHRIPSFRLISGPFVAVREAEVGTIPAFVFH